MEVLDGAADLQDDERCPEDTRGVRRGTEEGRAGRRERKNLLNRLRAKVAPATPQLARTNRSRAGKRAGV